MMEKCFEKLIISASGKIYFFICGNKFILTEREGHFG